jgi:hypothetical protein
VFLESFLRSLAKHEFGIFVLTPDDDARIRGLDVVTPRDNVILEAGIYLGRSGLGRAFLLAPKDKPELHLPSDTFGLTLALYDHEWASRDGECQAALGAACTKIERAIKSSDVGKRNLRYKVSHVRNSPKLRFPSKVWVEISNDSKHDVVLRAGHFEYCSVGFQSRNAEAIGDPSAGKYSFKFRYPNENVHKLDSYLLHANETVDTYIGADPMISDHDVRHAIDNGQVGTMYLTGLWLDEAGGTLRHHRKRI